MRIAIVVGHRKNSQGAVGSVGTSEYKLNTEVAKRISSRVSKHKIKIFYRRDDLSGYTERMKDLHKRIDEWGADVSVSLHFNAASNPQANGHEVLYCSSKGKKLAKKLNDKFTKYLGNKDRGIKHKTKGDRGGGFLCRGKSVCILAEPFFAAHQKKYMNGSIPSNILVSSYVDFIEEL